jgi:hypothetical protein
MKTAIDPETRVGALLEAYPSLEALLTEMAPAFEKLRNPILRRTVAKLATLEQAAKMGGVPLGEMIRRLREAAGVEDGALAIEERSDVAENGASWLTGGAVAEDIDAAAMLERGGHPIGRVREAAERLRPGEVIRLASPFRPEPLLETMRRSGLEVYCEQRGAGRFVSYFGKR